MTLAELSDFGQLVAGIASVGSLIAVAWQLRSLATQTQEAAKQSQAAAEATRAAVYTSTAGFMLEIDKYFVDHPEVRAIVYGSGGTGADDDRTHRSAAAAELMIDMFDAVLANTTHLRDDISSGWTTYIYHVLDRSPVLREFWRANRTWYGTETQRVIDARVGLHSTEPGPKRSQNADKQPAPPLPRT